MRLILIIVWEEMTSRPSTLRNVSDLPPAGRSSGLRGIAAEMALIESGPMIVKNILISFVGTDLEERFEQAGVKGLILSGSVPHVCVNSTTECMQALTRLTFSYRTFWAVSSRRHKAECAWIQQITTPDFVRA